MRSAPALGSSGPLESQGVMGWFMGCWPLTVAHAAGLTADQDKGLEQALLTGANASGFAPSTQHNPALDAQPGPRAQPVAPRQPLPNPLPLSE